MLTELEIINFPVKHISWSAMRQYLTDRQTFLKRYIRFEFDNRTNPAMMEGNAFHQVLAALYQQQINEDIKPKKTSAECLNIFLKKSFAEMEQKATEGLVDWGVTGSLEKSKEIVEKAVGFYLEEAPSYKPVLVEERFFSNFEDLNGDTMEIPLKGFMDLVAYDKKDLAIVDHKLVSAFSDPENPEPGYELQGAAYFLLAQKCHDLKEPVKKIIFDEVKKTKNRDGSPQRQSIVIPVNQVMIARFTELYKRVVQELAGRPLVDAETGIMRFLPNPFAAFGAEESWKDFCEEVDSGRPGWSYELIKDLQQNAYEKESLALEI